MLKYLIIFSLFSMNGLLYAQDTVKTSVFTPNTSEIINLEPIINTDDKITITNLNEIKINEAPGSVYVITAEDIEKNGYKDLQDIFMNIPGFTIATDVQNGTGLMLRGSWTSEAKLLFMIDGMTMNDMAYGSFVLGGRIPLLSIQRIEIIRGASSSIYGGVAGLGVVNIITKGGKTSKGNAFLIDGGISQNKLSQIRLTFANTSYLLNDFEISVTGSVFNGNKSNKSFTQSDSSFVNFKDSSLTNNVFVEMKLKRKGFEYKVLYDDYNFQSTYERITSLARNFINEITLSKKINKLSLVGNATYRDQIPWNTQYGDPAIYDVQNLKTNRLSISTIANYEFSKNINTLLGVVYNSDYMRFYRPGLALNNGKTQERFNSFASFIEIDVKTKYVNMYIGGRYDKYETFKSNFAPRISFAKEFKTLNYKLIYGESFKIPTLQNINLSYGASKQLVPEKIKDLQAEIGIKYNQQRINANVFLTSIQDNIVYGYDIENKIESYVNQGGMVFAGYEILLHNSWKAIELKSSYSNYNVLQSTSSNYLVDTANLKMGTLAAPKHKFCSNLQIQLSKKNSLIFNYIFQTEKFTFEQTIITTGEYNRIRYKPTHLVDIAFKTKTLFKFFDVMVGIKNILNTNNFYNFPLVSGYPTAIGMGREFFTQIKINL